MKFVLVSGRTPRTQSFCALCCESIGESYLRDIATQLAYCNHKCYVDAATPDRFSRVGLLSKPKRLNPSDNMENYHEEVHTLGCSCNSLYIPCNPGNGTAR
jgi:hypothetical protein